MHGSLFLTLIVQKHGNGKYICLHDASPQILTATTLASCGLCVRVKEKEERSGHDPRPQPKRGFVTVLGTVDQNGPEKDQKGFLHSSVVQQERARGGLRSPLQLSSNVRCVFSLINSDSYPLSSTSGDPATRTALQHPFVTLRSKHAATCHPRIYCVKQNYVCV